MKIRKIFKENSLHSGSDANTSHPSNCQKHYIINLLEGCVLIKVKVTLEQATKAQRGDRGIALLFLDLDSRWDGWSAPRPDRFTPGKDPVLIVQEAGWAPGSV
jgi:hypothetical protein